LNYFSQFAFCQFILALTMVQDIKHVRHSPIQEVFGVRYFFWVLIVALFLTACQPQEPYCAENDLTYLDLSTWNPSDAEINTPGQSPVSIDVDGKTMQFDQVIHGPLCNNHLSGSVYIACDIGIPQWQGTPNFLDGCDLEIDQGSVITVAAHNNTPYYQGCDNCHKSKPTKEP
jgi:hypothetical protein